MEALKVSSPGSDSLQRFGLAEVLAVLAPGATFLLFCLVWVPGDQWGWILDRRNSGDSLIVTVSFLLSAYVAGLVLSVWAVHGWLMYVRARELFPTRRRMTKPVFLLGATILWILHGWRYQFQFHGARDTEMRLALFGHIRRTCGEGVSQSVRPFDFLHFFRTVAWGSTEPTYSRMLLEADFLYRRRLFCQGVALTMMLGGLQAGIRLALLWPRSFRGWLTVHFGLGAICLGGILASFLLREVAFNLHSDEAKYTYALCNLGVSRSKHPQN